MASESEENVNTSNSDDGDTSSTAEDMGEHDYSKVWAGKNDAWLTAGIIVADVVGAGILGMPRAVATFGMALGAVVMVIMLAANVHISILLWKVRVFYKPCDGAHTYKDLCKGAFSNAPRWQRRAAYITTGISQYSFMFGLLGIYLLSAGKGLGMLFHTTEMCLPTWAAIAACVLLPFAGTAREMGTYQSLVWINIITLCGTVLIPLVYFVIEGADAVRREGSQMVMLAHLTPTGVLSGLSTFTFGMTSQFMLTEIISEMKDPHELPKAYVNISAPFQLVAFMVAGLGGYYYLGDKLEGMINENLPFNAALQAAALCMLIHMLISYLIKGVVFCRAVLTKAKQKYSSPDDPRKRSLAAWNAVVIPTLLCAWLFANLVPFFGDAVDLLGASFTPLSCWVMPIIMFVRYYMDADDDERPDVGILEWIVMAAEMALGLVLMVLGTKSSIQTILSNWAKYGYPFECHCQGLWSTCTCSPHHIGMEQCGSPALELPFANATIVNTTLARLLSPM
mmetsp:Transcript_112399/g.290364  ORF Transcript_112399/g.290364 Transcript_112399/m.290364 type:complete len:509 (+) Transcript_112399:76-1602(+)